MFPFRRHYAIGISFAYLFLHESVIPFLWQSYQDMYHEEAVANQQRLIQHKLGKVQIQNGQKLML